MQGNAGSHFIKIIIITAFYMTQHSNIQRLQVKFIALIGLILSPFFLLSQVSSKDSLLAEVTLKNAINYAIIHQPQVQQSLIDQQIVESNIRSRLSEMYPQVNFNYSLQHNFIIQTAVIGGNSVKLGVNNTSAGQFSFTQSIFSKDVLLANRTKADVRQQASQATSRSRFTATAITMCCSRVFASPR